MTEPAVDRGESWAVLKQRTANAIRDARDAFEITRGTTAGPGELWDFLAEKALEAIAPHHGDPHMLGAVYGYELGLAERLSGLTLEERTANLLPNRAGDEERRRLELQRANRTIADAVHTVDNALLWQRAFARDTGAERRITLLLDVLKAILTGQKMTAVEDGPTVTVDDLRVRMANATDLVEKHAANEAAHLDNCAVSRELLDMFDLLLNTLDTLERGGYK